MDVFLCVFYKQGKFKKTFQKILANVLAPSVFTVHIIHLGENH